MSAGQKRSIESKVTIKIPRALYTRLSETISGSGFHSVTEFIVYVLRDLVSIQIDDKKKAARLTEEEVKLTKKEIEAMYG